jgi:hypothetical protein
MNVWQNALLVRQVKGAPSTILLMMLVLDRPTDCEELMLLTAYSIATVQSALDQLALTGIAQVHQGDSTWALTPGVRRVLLPAPKADAGLGTGEQGWVADVRDTSREREGTAPVEQVLAWSWSGAAVLDAVRG